jgi:hypothetical protein
MDTIFNIQYNGPVQLLISCGIFLAAGCLLWYLFMLLFSKLLYRKGRPLHKDHKLRLTGLWATTALILLLCVYFFWLIKRTGFDNINWAKAATYLGLLPLLLLYLLVMGFFALRYTQYKKQLPFTKTI